MQRKVSIVPIGQERLGVLALSVGQCWPTTNYDQSPGGGKFQGRNMVYPGPTDPYFLSVILMPEPHFPQNFDP